MIDGTLFHFSAGGLFNGLALLIDDETRTYWDHITGEAVHGPRTGSTLDAFPISMTTVAALRSRFPEARGAVSKPSLLARFFSKINGNVLRRKGFLPPRFRGTMGDGDDRLPAMEPGLGVVAGPVRRFYPMAELGNPAVDTLDGRAITVALGELDGTPHATFEDGTQPFQLMTRWYGFSYTYPGCELWRGGT
jgi:hypothetical protein